ncbi:MAG: D-alanyl-D-alanine carboxypeptidase/D-alanyl-D-alanine-endopeptidase [Ignavibacteriales bacterium]|nr:MAG: D-alanyl-D-alanine carboxypeptidase/D-alanyl-D-alanine-endopeptidase [Ignavibacteriales bacterium]
MKTLVIIFLFTVGYVSGQDYRQFKILVDSLAGLDLFANSSWSLYAEDIDNNKTIIDFESNRALAPASCQKLVTTSAGFSLLGKNYKYETKIYYSGVIDNRGILTGDIHIVGSGDPTLGSGLRDNWIKLDSLMSVWVNALKEKGIKIIEGSVLANDLYFDNVSVPDNWFWVDIGNYYGTGTSGLTINNNLYYLYFKPADSVGGKAEVLYTIPEIPNLTFNNFMLTGEKGSGDNGYIYCAPGQFNATLRGTIPAGVKEFSIKGSIPDPALFAAQYFNKKLSISGIKITGAPSKIYFPFEYDEEKKIISTISPALKDIIFVINKRSNNIFTEQLLKTIAKVKTGTGSFEKGIQSVMDFLNTNHLPTAGVNLSDGCGLSHANTVTTKLLVKLLGFNYKQDYFPEFYKSLGIAGDKNDFGYFGKYGENTIIANNARIKDGYIQNVRSHTGYIKSKNGRMIAFSFIANNYNGSSRLVDNAHLKLLIKLANLE